MIKVGKYTWVNSEISSAHFPIKGERTKEVMTELVHFNRYIESADDVLRELDKSGLRPATIEELLAFSLKYPEIQRQFPIVALGSFWQRFVDRLVPYLWSISNERTLFLHWFELRWFYDSRFLAVRK